MFYFGSLRYYLNGSQITPSGNNAGEQNICDNGLILHSAVFRLSELTSATISVSSRLSRAIIIIKPINAFAACSVCATKVHAIHIGGMTVLVPSGSLELMCTVLTDNVLVTVLRAERHASM